MTGQQRRFLYAHTVVWQSWRPANAFARIIEHFDHEVFFDLPTIGLDWLVPTEVLHIDPELLIDMIERMEYGAY